MNEYENSLKRRYLPLLERFGGDYRAVDWGSRESQWLRFRVLLGLDDVAEASVLDVGCGVGHMVDYLTEVGFRGAYRGIDLLAEMIGVARQRHPDFRFEQIDLATDSIDAKADYVFSSGLFTFADDDRLRDTVKIMFTAANTGLAFNSLSAWAVDKEDGEFHADPLDTLAFCRTLTPRVVLRHDYHPRDFTVYLYKDAAP